MQEKLIVLIIGNGSREHAISHAYEKSKHVKKIIVAPGNDFIGYQRKKEVIIEKECLLNNQESLLKIAKKYHPDLIDVAQDNALALGAVDLLQEHGFLVFGPKKAAARIEWDKEWSKNFMKRHQIPSSHFKSFSAEGPAKEYVKEIYSKNPDKLLYIKAAGLCEGKGALKSKTLKEAMGNIERMKTFPNDAGKTFLVEDGLQGEEFSYYIISDGETYTIFKSAQDNKTVFNFDEGDQTGGMGAISPAQATENLSQEIEEHLIKKVIRGMAIEKIPYQGILYLGGIIVEGKPFAIEYNTRWGDPECQVVLPSLETDYTEMVMACMQKNLHTIKIAQDKKTRVCVVGASRGYPKDYSQARGKQIYSIQDAMETEDILLFGSGISINNGKFYVNGGRLFSIVSEGSSILEARQKAYAAIAKINIEGNNLHYRTDIGWRDMERFLK